MKRFSRSIALAAVALGAVAASLFAGQSRGTDRGILRSGQGLGRTEHCLSTIELSAKQKTAVETIRSNNEAARSADVEAWKASQAKLRDDIARGADKSVLDKDVREREVSAAKVRGSSESFRTQILAALTPEQRIRFNACVESGRESQKYPNPPASKR